jgi:hypothetical protein
MGAGGWLSAPAPFEKKFPPEINFRAKYRKQKPASEHESHNWLRLPLFEAVYLFRKS